MKRFIIFLCIVAAFFAVSCSGSHSHNEDSAIYAADSLTLELGSPKAMYVSSGYLFLIDRNATEGIVQVYDLKEKRYCFSFANMGQGPEEFVSLNNLCFYEEDGESLVDIYDFNNKIVTYRLSSIFEERESVKPLKIQSISKSGMVVMNLQKYRGGYVTTGFYKDHKLALLDNTLNLIQYAGEYRQKPNSSISDETHALANYGYQYMSSDLHYLADCVTAAPLITLYELTDNNASKKWDYVIGELDYEVKAEYVPVYKSTRGYVGVSFSKERVYAIFSGDPADSPDACGREIHVFDIQTGELVQKLLLDRKSSHIVVDEDNRQMYVETNFPEPVVLIYDLPKY